MSLLSLIWVSSSWELPAAILAASAIGYVCANGISLFAYVKAKLDPRFSKLERPFKAPEGWQYVALLFGIFNLPLCLIGVIYLNSLEVGWTSTIVGFVVLALYIPLWYYSQNENQGDSGERKSHIKRIHVLRPTERRG